MEDIVIQSPEKPWLRKVAMMILTLGPILAWYKIPFPVALGYALLLFLSVFSILKHNFKVSVLHSSFLLLFVYICGSWSVNHNFGFWTLFPPGGWLFFIFTISLIAGVQLFDYKLCIKYMRWVVLISIALFFVQLAFLLGTGSQHFCFVPPITGEFTYEDMTYSEMVSRHLSSKHPCSIFLEKSYMAYYLTAYLGLKMFSEEQKDVLFSKESLIIILTLLLLRSGSGLVGLVVLLMVKLFVVFWTKKTTYKILLLFLVVPFSVGGFYAYQSTEAGQEALSRQEEFTRDGASGNVRVVAGYMIFDMLSPIEKIVGKPDARETYSTMESESGSRFYINGVQTILITHGIIGAVLCLLFYGSVFKKVRMSSKMCIVVLLTMSLLEYTYLNPYMILLTVIPCADFYYKKVKYN